MLRNLVILGICAGVSALIPTLYQSNPDAFLSLLGLDGQSRPVEPKADAVRVAPAVTASAPLGKKVMLPADERGHFSGDFKFNGRKVEAMVDTGATVVAINLSTARRIGLALKSTDFTLQIDTANGKTRAAAVNIDSVQVGRIVVEGVQAVVLDDKALNGTLIGMSFLKRLDKYQVEDGTLLLIQ
jgi:aspartyl protease family protein